MFKFYELVTGSLSSAIREFRSNKLRTFLSLFGITIGIFCIIGVLATVDSLQKNVEKDLNTMGKNTIFVDKWDWSDKIPWWKLVNRPVPKYEDLKVLETTIPDAQNLAFLLQKRGALEYNDNSITNVKFYGATEGFLKIQDLPLESGRYLQPKDYEDGVNYAVIGYNLANELFGNPDKAVGRSVIMFGRKVIVIGLLKKRGQGTIGDEWQFDDSFTTPYHFMKYYVKEDRADPLLMVQGKGNVPLEAMKDEVRATMRSIRKLRPAQADNFSLNDMDMFKEMVASIFSGLNAGGFAIAILSLVVGMFGVANIMFVTVRERTPQIGLKKALGAKKSTIMMEFLLESSFLCILGGLIGLVLVFILTLVFSKMLGFDISISLGILATSIGICIFVGVLAGIIPARIAAKMDPVVAIRSK